MRRQSVPIPSAQYEMWVEAIHDFHVARRKLLGADTRVGTSSFIRGVLEKMKGDTRVRPESSADGE